MSDADKEAQRQSFAKGNAVIDEGPDARKTIAAQQPTADVGGDAGFEAWLPDSFSGADEDVAREAWNAARADLLAKIEGVQRGVRKDLHEALRSTIRVDGSINYHVGEGWDKALMFAIQKFSDHFASAFPEAPRKRGFRTGGPGSSPSRS